MEYAIKLLNHARNNTEEAMALLKEGYRPREIETRYTCTSLCHDGIEDRSISFGETAFPHRSHLADMDCTDCHSPRETHGETYFKNCAVCHHGEGAGEVKCTDCHQAVGNVFYGKTAVGVENSPSFKVDVTQCDDCHRGALKGLVSGFRQVSAKCIECHDKTYGETLFKWEEMADALIKDFEPRIARIKGAIRDQEKKGKHTFVFTKLFGDAEYNFNLVKMGKAEHNLEYAQDVLDVTGRMLDEVEELLAAER